MPQPPQLLGSVSRQVWTPPHVVHEEGQQVLPQSVWLGGQARAPWEQFCPERQQVLPQSVWLGGQAHAPFEQFCPEGQQVLPQSVWLGGQAHMPSEQICPEGQHVSPPPAQPPQLLGSVSVLVHPVRQQVSPGGQQRNTGHCLPPELRKKPHGEYKHSQLQAPFEQTGVA